MSESQLNPELVKVPNQLHQFNPHEITIIRLGEDPEDFDHFIEASMIESEFKDIELK